MKIETALVYFAVSFISFVFGCYIGMVMSNDS